MNINPLNLTAQKHQRKDLFFHSLIPAILGRIARAAQNQAKALGISGNMEGDGFQKGGVLIVDKAGKKIVLSTVVIGYSDWPPSPRLRSLETARSLFM